MARTCGAPRRKPRRAWQADACGVRTRASTVGTRAESAGQVQDDKQQDQDDPDDPEHDHPPARPPGGWFAAWIRAEFIASVGVGRRASHAGVLSVGWSCELVETPAVLSRHFVAVKSSCLVVDVLYAETVPKLWTETIEAHRRAVRDAALDTTAALVAEHGLASVTMSQIAEETGIGRATLYKYFPDVEAILVAWHERQVSAHLLHLAAVRDQAGDPGQQLAAVFEAYALLHHDLLVAHGTELAAVLHRGEHVVQAQRQLSHFIGSLLAAAAATGDVRDDIAPNELAIYCLHALTAANTLPSKAAVHRLVKVTLAGVAPNA